MLSDLLESWGSIFECTLTFYIDITIRLAYDPSSVAIRMQRCLPTSLREALE